jgi:N-acetylmuramoyl-L-alanine amidase
MIKKSTLLTLCLFLVFALVSARYAEAAVEISLRGHAPTVIQEVYNRGGVAYVALDQALPALNMSGGWNSVEHIYEIKTRQGTAVIFPGCRYLRLRSRFVPLPHPPLFLDGKLRVAEDFFYDQLSSLLGIAVDFRNLDPGFNTAQPAETSLDRLFAFILKKKEVEPGSGLRGLAIDPGHGGTDPGCVGLDGVKEKDVVLEVARLLSRNVKMRLGIPVFLTRDKDYSLNLEKRLQVANQPQVDALILLHAQAGFTPDVRGITLYIRGENRLETRVPGEHDMGSRLLADYLADMLKRAGFTVNPIQRADLLPLGQGDLPSVLIEMGYLTNPEDKALLVDGDYQKNLANVIFDAIQEFSESQKEKTP